MKYIFKCLKKMNFYLFIFGFKGVYSEFLVKCQCLLMQMTALRINNIATILLLLINLAYVKIMALFFIIIWGFTSLSTLYRSYHDG